MKLWKRLTTAVFAASLIAVMAAVGLQIVIHYATTTEDAGTTAEWRARKRAEQIADATHDSAKLALVLVPVTVVLVWWMSKRRKGVGPSTPDPGR